ncbi:hypothetical protein [Gilvimarinus xylanilyticus]|uniref:Uncharacterized protein n=1 Tax=Gilvimarinus xylanilyticus TaxID=2944139 RepID=A0A9X2KSG1_9GAMM|nr:hypothetical protein [Gilvimarinus xylanilyticus]MCP8898214.1 hypothetical protein [Gilvimarinus xylanilyticus]
MTRCFDVVLCGTGIYFDNFTETPIIGFLTARRVAAADTTQAIKLAQHQVLVHWNQSYNAEHKLGVPRLEAVTTTAIRKWLRRALDEDYFFYDSEAVKARHLAHIHHTARPWYRL